MALLGCFGLGAATALFASGLVSEGSAQSGGGGAGERLSPQQVEQVETIIREYLLEHPEVIVDAMRELERRRQEVAARQVRDTVAARWEELSQDPDSPVVGNPEGDVTVIEFFDYQCPYCRAVVPDLATLLEEDGNIRLVYKEWPILGPVSDFAARAALAAREQGKYEPFHEALMAETGRLSEERVLAVAKNVGLDVERLKRDMDDPAIQAALGRTRELAAALGISGTPAFLFGEELIPGAIGIDQMRELVQQAREQG